MSLNSIFKFKLPCYQKPLRLNQEFITSKRGGEHPTLHTSTKYTALSYDATQYLMLLIPKVTNFFQLVKHYVAKHVCKFYEVMLWKVIMQINKLLYYSWLLRSSKWRNRDENIYNNTQNRCESQISKNQVLHLELHGYEIHKNLILMKINHHTILH